MYAIKIFRGSIILVWYLLYITFTCTHRLAYGNDSNNHQNILDSIEDFEESLAILKGLIKRKDDKALVDYFNRVKVLRDNSVKSDEL